MKPCLRRWAVIGGKPVMALFVFYRGASGMPSLLSMGSLFVAG